MILIDESENTCLPLCRVLWIIVLLIYQFVLTEFTHSSGYQSKIVVHNDRNAVQQPDAGSGKGASNHESATAAFKRMLQAVFAVLLTFPSADVQSTFAITK